MGSVWLMKIKWLQNLKKLHRFVQYNLTLKEMLRAARVNQVTKLLLCGVEAHSAILATASDFMQHEKRFEVSDALVLCSRGKKRTRWLNAGQVC